LPGIPYDPGDLNDREQPQVAAVAPSHHMRNAGNSIGENQMRSVLALGLLIALCGSASAARVHHVKPRHIIVRDSQAAIPGPVRDSLAAVPGFVVPPSRYDDTPSYRDPSKFGGGAP
jgi:hypothetical protein